MPKAILALLVILAVFSFGFMVGATRAHWTTIPYTVNINEPAPMPTMQPFEDKHI